MVRISWSEAVDRDWSVVVRVRLVADASDSNLTGRGRKLVVRDRGSVLGVVSGLGLLVGLSWCAEVGAVSAEALLSTGAGSRIGEGRASYWRANAIAGGAATAKTGLCAG
jgi:hypothetical protein